MKICRQIAVSALSLSLMLAACGAKTLTPKDEYNLWLKDLKTEMSERGISEKTLKKAFAKDYYHESPEVVKIDRKQPEFQYTSTDYLNRVITKKRVNEARQRHKELKPLLNKLEKKYGNAHETYIPAATNVDQTDEFSSEPAFVPSKDIPNQQNAPDLLKQLQSGQTVIYATFQDENTGAALAVGVDGEGKSYITIDYKSLRILRQREAQTLDAL